MPNISDFVVQALELEGKPLHVTVLVEKMIELGWEAKAADPWRHVYSSMYSLVKRYGDNSPVKVLKGRMFSLDATNVDASNVITPKETQPRKQVGNFQGIKQLTITDEARACGNCVHCEFHGINEITKRSGICSISHKSERLTVYPNGYHGRPCSEWSQKSYTKVLSEQKAVDVMLTAIAKAKVKPSAHGRDSKA